MAGAASRAAGAARARTASLLAVQTEAKMLMSGGGSSSGDGGGGGGCREEGVPADKSLARAVTDAEQKAGALVLESVQVCETRRV